MEWGDSGSKAIKISRWIGKGGGRPRRLSEEEKRRW